MTQLHVFISGFVQGVGYRQFVRHHAQKLELTGWVGNLPDRRVEVVLQGEKEVIERLVLLCRKGPPVADIVKIETTWEEGQDIYETFEVRT